MIVARIARHLLRKLAKPAALWLNDRALRQSEEAFEHYRSLYSALVPMQRYEQQRQVELIGRRNAIRGW